MANTLHAEDDDFSQPGNSPQGAPQRPIATTWSSNIVGHVSDHVADDTKKRVAEYSGARLTRTSGREWPRAPVTEVDSRPGMNLPSGANRRGARGASGPATGAAGVRRPQTGPHVSRRSS